MQSRSVISVHSSPETEKRLAKLSKLTRRSKSFLANEAIERYLKEEEAFVASVQRGQDDANAGRVVDTAAAREQIAASLKASKT